MRARDAIVAACLSAAITACAGSIPSIPNTPDAVIARADQYYARNKYFGAAELYKAFIERYPGHDRSDYAQFRLAESYFNDEQYELAAVEFQVVLVNFGYSTYADESLFRIGVCYWRLAPKAAKEQTKSREALSKFEQFVQTYTTSPLVEEARKYVGEIHTRLAEKDMLAVRFYYQKKRYAAALIYCNKIIDNYPDNEYWAEAHYFKGQSLMAQGKKEEAVKSFARVMEYPGELAIKKQASARLKSARMQ